MAFFHAVAYMDAIL